MPSRRTVIGLLALVTAAAGCSGSSKHIGAAEPATAPPTTAAPAGVVRPVGAEPEGIVYDLGTKLVAVAVRNPDRLVLLSPVSLAVMRTVPLPGSVRHLQLARPGGPVLVPDESARRLIQVSMPGGAEQATDVGKQPHDATALGGGQIAVGNEFGKSVSVIEDGRVRSTITGLKQPGGVVGAGATFAVVDVGSFLVSTYDVRTLHRLATVRAGAGPTHGVLLSGDRLLVADTRGDALLVYSLPALHAVGRLPLPGTPYGLATDPTTNLVWVTLTARNQVAGVDVAGPAPKVVATYPTVRQPNTVAVEPGSHRLWVTGTADGVVQLITR